MNQNSHCEQQIKPNDSLNTNVQSQNECTIKQHKKHITTQNNKVKTSSQLLESFIKTYKQLTVPQIKYYLQTILQWKSLEFYFQPQKKTNLHRHVDLNQVEIFTTISIFQQTWFQLLNSIEKWQLELFSYHQRKQYHKDFCKQKLLTPLLNIHFQKLQSLYLPYMGLTNIEFLTFINAPQLIELDLSDNYITKCKPVNKLRRSQSKNSSIRGEISFADNKLNEMSQNRIQLCPNSQGITQMVYDWISQDSQNIFSCGPFCFIDLNFIVKSQLHKINRDSYTQDFKPLGLNIILIRNRVKKIIKNYIHIDV